MVWANIILIMYFPSVRRTVFVPTLISLGVRFTAGGRKLSTVSVVMLVGAGFTSSSLLVIMRGTRGGTLVTG